MKYDIKCDCCGRFIKPPYFYLFVPDSDVSGEEEIHRCLECTCKFGKPISMQFPTHIHAVCINKIIFA